MKKKKIVMVSLSIVLGLILLLGFSYAWLTLTLTGTKQNIIKVGSLSLKLDDSMTRGIQIENAVPTLEMVALKQEPYHFTVENKGNIDTVYSFYLDNKSALTSSNLSRFNFVLKKDGKILNWNTLNRLDDNSPLFSGTIHPGEKSDYELYLWLDSRTTAKMLESFASDTYEGELRLVATQQKERKLYDYALHACDGLENCTRTKDTFTYFQNGYYAGSVADDNSKYVFYSGKQWILTGYDEKGNVKAVVPTELVDIPWGPTLDYQGSYVERWLTEEFLPTLNDYQNYLVTDYAWNYSDDTGRNFADPIGTDKIVRGPVGLLNKEDFYYGSNGDSYIDSTDYIHNKTSKRSYLGTKRIDGNLWLSGQYDGINNIYKLNHGIYGVSPAIVFRSDVKVVSGSGTGTDPYILKDDTASPGELLNTRYSGEYIAFGDGLNASYRITKVENGLTKVISTHSLVSVEVDEDIESWTNLGGPQYDATTGEETYPYVYQKGNGDYLHYDVNNQDYPLGYFLNHEFLNPSNGFLSISDRQMIKENQFWYTGTVTSADSYQNAKDESKKVTATVGLPIVGEAFSSIQAIDSINFKFFLRNFDATVFLTNNGSTVYARQYESYIEEYQEEFPWRPSFYLNDNVKIKSGSGTKNDPYTLTME